MKTVGEEHEKPKQSELGRSGRSLRPSGLVEGRPRTDERNTRHGSPESQGRSSFSAGVRAVVRRRRDPRAGSALVQHWGRGRDQQARQQHICAPHMTASACAPRAVVVVRTMCVMKTTLRHPPRNNASLPFVS